MHGLKKFIPVRSKCMAASWASQFKRIHRSYIVALDKIQAIVGNMIEVIEKGQNKHLPIGKNYRDELLELVNQKRL